MNRPGSPDPGSWEQHRLAGRRLDQSLVLARAVGDRYDEAENLIALAAVRRDAGRSTTALELARPR